MTSRRSQQVSLSSLFSRQKIRNMSLLRICDSSSQFTNRTRSSIYRYPFSPQSTRLATKPSACSFSRSNFLIMCSNQCDSHSRNASTREAMVKSQSRAVQKGFFSSSLREKISCVEHSSRSTLLMCRWSIRCRHLWGEDCFWNHFLPLRNFQSSLACATRVFSSTCSWLGSSQQYLKSAVSGSSLSSTGFSCWLRRISLILCPSSLAAVLLSTVLWTSWQVLVDSLRGTLAQRGLLGSASSFLELYFSSLWLYFSISASRLRLGGLFSLGGWSDLRGASFLAGISTLGEGLLGMVISWLQVWWFCLILWRKRMRSALRPPSLKDSSTLELLLSDPKLLSFFNSRLWLFASLYFLRICSTSLQQFCFFLQASTFSSWKTSDSIMSLPASLQVGSAYSVLRRWWWLGLSLQREGLSSMVSLLISFLILQLRSSMLLAFSSSKCFSFSACWNRTP